MYTVQSKLVANLTKNYNIQMHWKRSTNEAKEAMILESMIQIKIATYV